MQLSGMKTLIVYYDIVIQINEQLNKQTFLMHNEVKPDLDQVNEWF